MCRGIARVGLLLSYHRCTDLGRISHPQFVVIGMECFLEPLRVDRRFHAYTSWTGKCGVKLPRLTVLVFRSIISPVVISTIAIC